MERLWQLYVLYYCCEKQVTRSSDDKEAINFSEPEVTRLQVNGILCYAMPVKSRSCDP